MKSFPTKLWIILATLFLNSTFLEAQKGLVKGKITDAQSSTPLSYASIRVFKNTDSSLVTGAITDDKGLFSIEAPVGQFYAVLDFMGYKALKTLSFSISKEQMTHDFGTVKLLNLATLSSWGM